MSSAQSEQRSPAELSAIRTEVDLLRRIGEGDREAFAQFYDRFSRTLFATAARILNDSTEAEDVVHDAFISLWNRAREFQADRGTPFSWVITLVRNRAIDRLRSRKRRSSLLEQSAPEDLGYAEISPGETSSVDHYWQKEKASVVRHALGELSADQRGALELAFFGGLTQLEIAEQLKEPLGTVKARIRRGLLKLRDTLAHRL